jgi:hypothetical protein
VSDWKPQPVTDSYKRTAKWEYYVPVDQRQAKKEYKKRLKQANLRDIESIPTSYVERFMNTTRWEYQQLRENGASKELAVIDLVKLFLGVNYLGEAQIEYISNAVLNAVRNYSASKLPSLVVFDKYDAAAVMTLTTAGYHLEKVVFKQSASLTDAQRAQRTELIKGIIDTINHYNQEAFKKRLTSYYGR